MTAGLVRVLICSPPGISTKRLWAQRRISSFNHSTNPNGDVNPAFTHRASSIRCYLLSHWSPSTKLSSTASPIPGEDSSPRNMITSSREQQTSLVPSPTLGPSSEMSKHGTPLIVTPPRTTRHNRQRLSVGSAPVQRACQPASVDVVDYHTVYVHVITQAAMLIITTIGQLTRYTARVFHCKHRSPNVLTRSVTRYQRYTLSLSNETWYPFNCSCSWRTTLRAV